MNKVNSKVVKEIVQMVLDCTLWGHFPYESMDIIKEESLKRQIEIYNELLKQKLKLQKQLNKVNYAYNIALASILKDRNTATAQNGKRFRSPDACVNARSKVTEDFVNHILAEIESCKIDPDVVTDIVLEIPYTLNYNNPHEYLEAIKIDDIKDALNDLWFVKSIQPVYNMHDKNAISQFICKCHFQVNAQEEQEEVEQFVQKIENDSEVGKASEFLEELLGTEAKNVRLLRKAVLDGVVDNTEDPVTYINSFKHEEVIDCTKQIFNELVSSTILEKRLSRAIHQLFIQDHYCESDKYHHGRIALDISESFLGQVIYAIEGRKITEDTIKFCTVITYDLSEIDEETEGLKYNEIFNMISNLWFVKDVYPHYDRLNIIDSLMIVCEIQIGERNSIDGMIKLCRTITCELSNCFYDFCKSMESKKSKLPIEDAVCKIIQKAATELAAYNPIDETNVSFNINSANILKIDINNLSCSIDPKIQLIDIMRYIEHIESLLHHPITFITPEFYDSNDESTINLTLSIFYQL